MGKERELPLYLPSKKTNTSRITLAIQLKIQLNMKRIFLVMILAVGLLVTGNNTAAAQNKFGFIDLNEVLSSMPEAKKADTLLREYNEALNANANDKQKEVNNKLNKFIADSLKMTPVAKEAKRRELQENIQELNGMDTKIQGQVESRRNELAAPIQKKAMDAVKAVAKDNGYTHVFPKEYVYVFPDADDLADKVKRKLGIK